jgi:hypothetical protein
VIGPHSTVMDASTLEARRVLVLVVDDDIYSQARGQKTTIAMSGSRARLQRMVQSLGKFHKPKPQLREAAKKTKYNVLRGDKVQVIGQHPERGKQGMPGAAIFQFFFFLLS